MDITIRNLDVDVYRKAKAAAAMEGANIGKVISEALKYWLRKGKIKKQGRSLLDFKPTHWGPGTEKTSQEIDKILYGD